MKNISTDTATTFSPERFDPVFTDSSGPQSLTCTTGGSHETGAPFRADQFLRDPDSDLNTRHGASTTCESSGSPYTLTNSKGPELFDYNRHPDDDDDDDDDTTYEHPQSSCNTDDTIGGNITYY